MAITFKELKRQVMLKIEARDGRAMLVVEQAINDAALLASLMFNPKELQIDGTVTVTGNTDNIALTTLTRYIDVVVCYNTTDLDKMFYIPIELWDLIVPSGLAVTRYYTVRGTTLYVAVKPSVNKTIRVTYQSYAGVLTLDSDSLSIDHYVPFIVSLATQIAQAALAGMDGQGVWSKLTEQLALPVMVAEKARSIIEGRPTLLELPQLTPAPGGVAQ